jgi:hypothetical protein
MPQTFTLNLDPANANALITALEVARRQGDFQVARTAVAIISELIRQDAEFKKANPVTTQPAPANAGGEPTQP